MKRIFYFVAAFYAGIILASTPREIYNQAVEIEHTDILRAIPLYRAAADSAYPPAQNYLGFLYFQGKGVTQNTDSALMLLQAAAAADYPKACNNLAWLLISAPAMQHDTTKAVYWLQRASDLGHAPSMLHLCRVLMATQTPPDTARIRNLAFKCAEKGVMEGGDILWKLDSASYACMPEDFLFKHAARYYFAGAAKPAWELLKRLPNNPKAILLKADATSRGFGVEYNYDDALLLYFQSAVMGDPSAQFIVSETLQLFPDALPLDTLGAEGWRMKAAEAGVTDSRTALQRMFDFQR